jgi:hypothetical protein
MGHKSRESFSLGLKVSQEKWDKIFKPKQQENNKSYRKYDINKDKKKRG